MKNTPFTLCPLLLSGPLMVVLTLFCGCVAGPGSVAHRSGDLDTTLAAGVTAAARAAQMTAVQLGYTPIRERQDENHLILIVRKEADQRLEIYLQRTNAGTTRIKIRTTPPGQESIQTEVLSKVRSNL